MQKEFNDTCMRYETGEIQNNRSIERVRRNMKKKNMLINY